MCCANSACEVCAGVDPAAGRKEKKRRGEKESGQGVNKADGQFKGWGFPFPDENSQHLIIMLGRSPVHLDIDIRQDI